MIKKIICLLFLLAGLNANAQTEPAMGDALRENGKIYVVISVIGIIFIALVIFLFMLERKLKRLEEKQNSINNIK